MGVTRLLLLGPFYSIQTNYLYFFAHDCKYILLIGVCTDSAKKVEDDTHDKIIELIRQESVNVDEMVKHMKDLEAQTSVDIQSDSPKSSNLESQPGNYRFT